MESHGTCRRSAGRPAADESSPGLPRWPSSIQTCAAQWPKVSACPPRSHRAPPQAANPAPPCPRSGAPEPQGPDPRVLLLLNEAYRHGKAVGGWNGSGPVLEAAGIGAGEPGVALGDEGPAVAGTVTEALGRHRAWDRFPPAI
ncbi:hypothetical protein [Streptomyces sp. NPDC089799]|uniref:hypothetical protein n=1 Tax=Streptomyces sp. NPDC089799 TaxID=3155066 RepID=UPI003431A864